ncbi:hypothetical protein CYMTET_54782 [Cymbomonas tetramitiformis]|uniref:Uncharacterized protein n=1 Tax=Cymbomonas tetramitiformis TaxID=36881 RepID=A0AAE0BFE9_9CHLO|nr:hypothetical protein CYMTET_54782 [Cymbomonas tetramitiformis]
MYLRPPPCSGAASSSRPGWTSLCTFYDTAPARSFEVALATRAIGVGPDCFHEEKNIVSKCNNFDPRFQLLCYLVKDAYFHYNKGDETLVDTFLMAGGDLSLSLPGPDPQVSMVAAAAPMVQAPLDAAAGPDPQLPMAAAAAPMVQAPLDAAAVPDPQVSMAAAAAPMVQVPLHGAAGPDPQVPMAAAAAPMVQAPLDAAAGPDPQLPMAAAAAPMVQAPLDAAAGPDPQLPMAAAAAPMVQAPLVTLLKNGQNR